MSQVQPRTFVMVAIAVAALSTPPLRAGAEDADIVCDFDGIVIDGEEQVACYDMDLVNECLSGESWPEETCFDEDTEAGPVFDPQTGKLKANGSGSHRLKRLIRKERMLKLKP